jgi:N-acetylglucosaminyl-diphospho-decaprenol L-rhamnosyltransferase
MRWMTDLHRDEEESSAPGHATTTFEDSGVHLGVVIVNFGMAAEMTSVIGSTLSNRTLNLDVMVVDNYYSDVETSACRALCEELGWAVISSPTNLGFGAACNLGAARLLERGATHLLFLNPDASIGPDDLDRLVHHSRSRPRAIVAPLIRLPQSDAIWFCGGRINWLTGTAYHFAPEDADGPIDWLTGACLLLPREVWVQLGGFDPSYFLYWEDVELTYRWKAQGGSLEIATDVVARHAVGTTQGTGDAKSPTYLYFNMVNRARFAQTHGTLTRRAWWLLTSPLYAIRLAGMSRKRLISVSAAPYLTALGRGLITSVRLLSFRRKSSERVDPM